MTFVLFALGAMCAFLACAAFQAAGEQHDHLPHRAAEARLIGAILMVAALILVRLA
jgi:hypothetical protein